MRAGAILLLALCTCSGAARRDITAPIDCWVEAAPPQRTPGVSPRILTHGKRITCLDFSRDGRRLLCGDDHGRIGLWDLESGERRLQWFCDSAALAVRFSSGGKAAICATRGGEVLVWELPSGGESRKIIVPGGPFRSASLSPAGDRVAWGTFEASLLIWDLAADHAVWRRGDVPSLCSAYSPDARTLASGGEMRGVQLQDATGGTWELGEAGKFVTSIAFSPDGRSLAVGTLDRLFRLYETETFLEVRRRRGHNSSVAALAFSGDGESLATGAEDGSLVLWDSLNGNEQAVLRRDGARITCMAFSGRGRRLAVGQTDGSVTVWDLPAPVAAPAEGLDEETWRRCWDELALIDGAKARESMDRLLRAQARTVPRLRDKLMPDVTVSERVRGLVRDLDDPDPEVRDRASAGLRESLREPSTELELLRGLSRNPTEEVRARVEDILRDGEEYPSGIPAVLRRARAVQILEILGRRGSDETLDLLRILAAEAPWRRVRRDAQAALDRRSENGQR